MASNANKAGEPYTMHIDEGFECMVQRIGNFIVAGPSTSADAPVSRLERLPHCCDSLLLLESSSSLSKSKFSQIGKMKKGFGRCTLSDGLFLFGSRLTDAWIERGESNPEVIHLRIRGVTWLKERTVT